MRSARYAGEDATDEENLAKLLREAPAGSALAYVCALAYVEPDAAPSTLVEGRCTGTLAAEPRGERRLRLRPGVRPRRASTTAARWPSSTDAEKDAISHRGRAARELLRMAATSADRPRRATRVGRARRRAAALSIASNTR